MAKNINAFWNSKSKHEDVEEMKLEILRLREDLEKAKDENMRTRMKIIGLKGKLLDEFRPEIKHINVYLDSLEDAIYSIEKQLNTQTHNICLRLDALEEDMDTIKKKERNTTRVDNN